MEGINDLQKLLDYTSGRFHIDPDFRITMDRLTRSPEILAAKLKAIARERGIDPDIIDNFDLAGIEVDSFQAFTEEVFSRFFGEGSLGPER